MSYKESRLWKFLKTLACGIFECECYSPDFVCNQIIINNLKIQGIIMGVVIKDTTTSISGSFGTPVSAKGNPTSVEEGTVVFTSSDEAVATVAADPNVPLGFVVTPTGVLGVVQITITADADMDEGEVREITGFTSVEVQPSEAVGFGEATFGAPQE